MVSQALVLPQPVACTLVLACQFWDLHVGMQVIVVQQECLALAAAMLLAVRRTAACQHAAAVQHVVLQLS